jgi:hypothetical protein
MSLSKNGTPTNGPCESGERSGESYSSMMALSTGLYSAIRERAAAMTSSAVTSPDPISIAKPTASKRAYSSAFILNPSIPHRPDERETATIAPQRIVSATRQFRNRERGRGVYLGSRPIHRSVNFGACQRCCSCQLRRMSQCRGAQFTRL